MKFKPIKGYEGLYEVSNNGRIFSLNYHLTGKRQEMKTQVNRHGYIKIMLSKKGKVKLISVHKIVAEAFIPNPYNYPEVLHKDNNKQNCNDWNLEWGTSSKNIKNAYDDGIMEGMKGVEHPMAIFTNKDVLRLRKEFDSNPIRGM